MRDHGKGLILGATGILLISPDALLLRLADCDDNAVVAIRSACMAFFLSLAVLALPSLRRGFRWQPVLLYGLFSVLALACFPLSIKNTHVANTLVIMAAAPILAAIGAYIFLREKTAGATWTAAAVIFIGIGILFSGTLESGGFAGDIMALLVAAGLAGGALIIRRHRQTPVYAGLIISTIITAAIFSTIADWQTVDGNDIQLLIFDGGLVAGAFSLVIAAARHMPPAEVNLLFLLETLLAPLWVWLVIGEQPPAVTLAAGSLIIAVLAVHGFWTLSRPPTRQ